MNFTKLAQAQHCTSETDVNFIATATRKFSY